MLPIVTPYLTEAHILDDNDKIFDATDFTSGVADRKSHDDLSNLFTVTPVIAELPREQMLAKLWEVGDTDTALSIVYDGAELRPVDVKSIRALRWDSEISIGEIFRHKLEAWEFTEHRVGFIPIDATADASNRVPIAGAGEIKPDLSLKNGRVSVSLDRLRVAKYPGGSKSGNHIILFDFETQNHVARETTE